MRSLMRRPKSINYVIAISLLLNAFPISIALARDKGRLENLRYELADGKVTIYYDIVGPKDKKYKVAVILRRDSYRTFRYKPKNLTGDVGTGRFAGRNRQIKWDILKEFPLGVEGSDYYFEVEVELLKGGISPLIWIGASAALVGGGAAYFLLAKKEETAPVVRVDLPLSPSRP